MIIISILMLMYLSLIVGCEEKQSRDQKVNASKLPQQQIEDKEAIYSAELESITSSAKISITNDAPCQTWFVPKTQ